VRQKKEKQQLTSVTPIPPMTDAASATAFDLCKTKRKQSTRTSPDATGSWCKKENCGKREKQ